MLETILSNDSVLPSIPSDRYVTRRWTMLETLKPATTGNSTQHTANNTVHLGSILFLAVNGVVVY
jgi:hypothetical protein